MYLLTNFVLFPNSRDDRIIRQVHSRGLDLIQEAMERKMYPDELDDDAAWEVHEDEVKYIGYFTPFSEFKYTPQLLELFMYRKLATLLLNIIDPQAIDLDEQYTRSEMTQLIRKVREENPDLWDMLEFVEHGIPI